MSGKMGLCDLDLQLYLAGAMPLSQRLRMALALLLNRELRNRLYQVKVENRGFQENEMKNLEAKLFPASRRHFIVTHSLENNSSRWNFAWAGSLALLALCALPLSMRFSTLSTLNEVAYIAKGHGLGVNLFVKGDTAYRVENQSASILPTDTLQVIPLGSGTQHIVLLGWDTLQGMVLLYPKVSAYSHQVTAHEPPPALLLQGIEDNRLICITSTAPFRVDQIMNLFNRQPYQSFTHAPTSRLVEGRYVQIFSIIKKSRRI